MAEALEEPAGGVVDALEERGRVVGRAAGECRVVGRPVAGDPEGHLPVEVAHDVAGHLHATGDVVDERREVLAPRAATADLGVEPLHLGADVALPQVRALVDGRLGLGRVRLAPALDLLRIDVGDAVVGIPVDDLEGVEVGGEGGDAVEAGDGALGVGALPVLLESRHRAAPALRPRARLVTVRYPPVHGSSRYRRRRVRRRRVPARHALVRDPAVGAGVAVHRERRARRPARQPLQHSGGGALRHPRVAVAARHAPRADARADR